MLQRRLLFLAVIAMLTLMACSDDSKDRPQAHIASDSITQLVGTANAGERSYAEFRARADTLYSQRTLAELMADLHTLPGEFTSEGVRGFTGDGAVILAIALHGDDAVMPLIECLGDRSKVVSTAAGAPLMLGHMCAAALEATAYFEETDESGDLAGSWDGALNVRATEEQLREAQGAWRSVSNSRTYVLRDL